MSLVRILNIVVLGTVLAGAVQAQVTLDGTLGPSGPLSGPNYAITADLGQQVGGNLFHSFGVFSIQTGESATFSGPNSVSNIIGRVTGGQVSFIDGALRSTISGANLYLLNPAGVLFGEHASLDVPGSVHVSTADYLKLGDGGRFDAHTPGNSVLTVAPVEAFGFLGDTPDRIAINGSFLQVPEGQTLSLIGGDISLTDATVYAPAGRINVVAAGSTGEVVPMETDVVMQSFERLGTLTIEHDPTVDRVTVDMGEPFGPVALGDLDTSGEGGGAIFIRGGAWVSHGGWVFADTYGNQHGRNLDFSAQGDMILENGAIISASTFGNGNAGKLTLRVARLKLIGGSQIQADAQGDLGHGGNLVIKASEFVFIAGRDANGISSALTTNTFTPSSSQGGTILIIAPVLTLDNSGQIVSATTGDGKAGNIRLDVGQLFLINGGQVSTNTGLSLDGDSVEGGSGKGGSLIVTASEFVFITGQDAEEEKGSRSGLFASSRTPADGPAGMITIQTPLLMIADGGAIRSITSGDGNGGYIDINVGQLSLTEGGQVNASTQGGGGQGGSITVTADESVFIAGQNKDGNVSRLLANSRGPASGDAGSINVKTPLLMIVDGGTIRSITSGDGTGGDITLVVEGQFILTGGSQINANTQEGHGKGGDVKVTATVSIFITGQDADGNVSGLLANSLAPASGEAGSITVETPLLVIADSGAIRSSTKGDGNAGDINLDVGHLSLTGGGRINTNTGPLSPDKPGGGAGRGGRISIMADESIFITGQDADGNMSGLFADSREPANGRAGSITLMTPEITIADGGGIFTRSDLVGGGNIIVNADHIKLFNGSQISSSVAGNESSKGGNITLNSTSIVTLDDSTITAQATQGRGGNIRVNADVFLHDARSTADVLNASSRVTGNDGLVQNNTPATDISGSLVTVDPTYLNVSGQLSPRCGAGDPEERSRFIVQGRGALPIAPDETRPVNASRCQTLPMPPVTVPMHSSSPVASFGFGDR